MAAAEDGNAYLCRPQAGGTEPDDAVDDATDVCLLCFIISQWSGCLLAGVKCYQHRYSVLCYWMGSFDSIKG